MEEKSLSNTNMEELAETTPDVEVFGNPGAWECVCKASSKNQGWMKSTKVLEIHGGCLVQVSTQHKDNVAEALCWVPGSKFADFDYVAESDEYEDEEEDEDGEEE